ncbi:signal peptidase II [Salinibius halmophilus]|uniref:signal peptidase II n=1 Tax=Salinibius halmophilus TaxID=1853216 RepID=UPI000E66700A|nr:signal peptidase II [Salinibius halmophilus]
MLKRLPGYSAWLILSLVIIGLDQWTKVIADSSLIYNSPVEVLPILNWTLHYNPGAAFSFLGDAGGWQVYFFKTIAFVVSAVMAVWLSRLKDKSELILAIGLALIIGGALGNAIDRILYDHVVDFISFHWQNRYFPTFNIADIAITCGAGLFIVDALFLEPKRTKQNKTDSEK